MKEIIPFLKNLKENNNREWFNENKSEYDKSRKILEEFTTEVINGISVFERELSTLNPKDCIFRIYRDVRFSKNKEPYKTNMGVFINRGGRKSKFAGYYFHIEPQNSFIGGGVWMPPSDVLKAVRSEIFYFTDEYKKIINEQLFVKLFGEVQGDKLKRPPKDFPPDFTDVELIKLKSYIVGYKVSDETVADAGFLQKIIRIFEVMSHFTSFLNRGIENI